MAGNPDLRGIPAQAHLSLDENIARSLRDSILVGDLLPGARLRQEQLAAHFQVSRIPIREALQQLEAEGLIQFAPRRGARVAVLSSAEIKEMFEMRAALEGLLIEKAVPELTEDDFAAAETLLRKMENIGSYKRWVEMNGEFHEGLYRAANRPLILAQVERLRNNAGRYIRLNVATFRKHDVAAREHAQILKACIDRDGPLASTLVKAHLLRVGSQLEALLLEK
jgi:DNA-binding GntR family transcriptional regulator